jgi:hypothetical protein
MLSALRMLGGCPSQLRPEVALAFHPLAAAARHEAGLYLFVTSG